MLDRIQSILLGLLLGAMGTFSCMAGLGQPDIGLQGMQGVGPIVSGVMFFFAGALSFYRGVLGPSAKGLPIYVWVNYLFILPILAGFAFTMLVSGLESDMPLIALSSVLPLGATVWYAVAKFPGRKPNS
jgi:hypothetical protein